MKIKELLHLAQKDLYVENPAKEANMLLSAFLNKSREWIFLHVDDDVANFEQFFNWVKRRANFEPLEYITGQASFYSRDFFVQPGVLIPRPETEILVDLAYKNIQNIQNPRVLEIGVGSGVISVMLALLHKNVTICATDVNEKATKLSLKNAKHFKVDDRIKFYNCSYESEVEGEFDLLVSNPPYIANNTELETHVLKEPHEALFGGKKGYEMLVQLVKIAKQRGIKSICCEMGYDQKDVMKEVLIQNGVSEFSFYKDLSSLDRGFEAKF